MKVEVTLGGILREEGRGGGREKFRGMKGLRRQISLPKFYRDKTDFEVSRIVSNGRELSTKRSNVLNNNMLAETETLNGYAKSKDEARQREGFARLVTRKLSRPLSRTSTDDRKAGSD